MYVGGELDPLTVGQTQHLVVVQYCVHVLNPKGVDRAVTHHPVVVHGGVLYMEKEREIIENVLRGSHTTQWWSIEVSYTKIERQV